MNPQGSEPLGSLYQEARRLYGPPISVVPTYEGPHWQVRSLNPPERWARIKINHLVQGQAVRYPEAPILRGDGQVTIGTMSGTVESRTFHPLREFEVGELLNGMVTVTEQLPGFDAPKVTSDEDPSQPLAATHLVHQALSAFFNPRMRH